MEGTAETALATRRRVGAAGITVALALAVLLLVVGAPSASAKDLGQWTDADVDTAIINGTFALDAAANKSDPNQIHWDGASNSGDVTDTGFAVAAIGAAYKAKPTNVDPGVLADAKNAVQWLISKQDTSGTTTNGSWGASSGSSDSNYATSIALMALSFFSNEPNAAQAIALGRNFEIMWQNAPPATTGNAGSNCTPPVGLVLRELRIVDLQPDERLLWGRLEHGLRGHRARFLRRDPAGDGAGRPGGRREPGARGQSVRDTARRRRVLQPG